MPNKPSILCAHRDASLVARLEHEIMEWLGSIATFESFDDGDALLRRALDLRAAKHEVAMVFCGLDLPGSAGASTLLHFHREPALRGTRRILLDAFQTDRRADDLLQEGALNARVDPDFDPERLHSLLRSQLTDYVIHSAPHLIDHLHTHLDLRSLNSAFLSAKSNLETLNARLHQVQTSVIDGASMSDDQIEATMIREFDELLDQPSRRHYAPGEILVREGDKAGSIWILREGRVKLYRTLGDRDVTFHSERAGRIVGLMSLSLQNPVFFSVQAVTEVRALVLTRDQVRDAVGQSPLLASCLITVILRSMARRNRRAVQLLTKVHQLNRRLKTQRDDLERALSELQAAQEQLIESEKMATLGTLSAGMAHELNNPVAAMQSAVRYLLEDLPALLAQVDELAPARGALDLARKASPISTRDQRSLTRELFEALGDKVAADRLVAAGIRSVEDYRTLEGLAPKRRSKGCGDHIVQGGQIGSALRNLENCSQRVATLVRSLKLYARSDQAWDEQVDLNATIEDALLILHSKLRDHQVEKQYGDLPRLRCIPSQLQQVWTNLLQNAAQAGDETSRIQITTSRDGEAHLRVEIKDHGCGIPVAAQPHIFSPRFTTKSGRVEFGLGLGLPICKTVIERHGGSITFQSRPGTTVFSVVLPIQPPTPEP